jgi:hypothetical protein
MQKDRIVRKMKTKELILLVKFQIPKNSFLFFQIKLIRNIKIKKILMKLVE